MAKEKKKEQQYYNGIAVDSQEEVMMIMWLEELIEAGYAERLERAETYSLSERLEREYAVEQQLKTKSKIVTKREILLEDHVYTPEFRVKWSQKAMRVFIDYVYSPYKVNKSLLRFSTKGGELTTIVEVKPNFDQNNMTRLFKINQKWMWQRYGLFVNLVQPHKLFEETFTPKAWLVNSSGKKRVIHWEVRTLEEYVNSLNNQ